MRGTKAKAPAHIARLAPPGGKASVVLDTDTFNEIDDQFAVVYSLLSPERIDVEAIYAAPFHNSRSTGPGDGMEQSYEEILRLLERLDVSYRGLVHRGSKTWLEGPETPVASPAAENLIERATEDRDGPLYVVAIGAITNVASAILMEPGIVDRIVVVWLAGNPYSWHTAEEFNLKQDMHASRLIFDCGVPLVHIPCANVAEHLRTTVPEVERHVKGQGPTGDYLFEIFAEYGTGRGPWSKVIWDISAIAWLIDHTWVPTVLAHSPILTSELTWSHDPRRHMVRVATHTDRDAIFGDLFGKLEARAHVE